MGKDFQTWWNAKYFDTNYPYYNIYQALHKAKADLDYIEYLRVALQQGDHLIELALQGFKGGLKKSKRTTKKSIPPNWRNLPLTSLIGEEAMEEWYRQGKEREEAMRWSMAALDYFIRKEEFLRKKREQIDAGLKLLMEKSPVFKKIFMECDEGPKGGRKSDRRGSFFLLAVSEHLREKRGKPQYRMAARLLKTIRGQHFASGYQDRTNAKTKVHKLKKTYPDWESYLKIVKRQFSRMRLAIQSA